MKLPPQLEAHKLKQDTPSDSVFIYSALNLPRKDSTTQLIAQYGELSDMKIFSTHSFSPLVISPVRHLRKIYILSI